MGMSLIGFAGTLVYYEWTAAGPLGHSHLFETVGFDLLILAIVVGLLTLGSILPALRKPKFEVYTGRSNQFNFQWQASDDDLITSGASDIGKVKKYVTVLGRL
jgi:hypothetical protein